MNNGSGGSRERLTRERICEAALEAIDEGGLDSFNMRALASSLDVKASSLYYHFKSKDELLTGCAEFLYRRLGRPPQDGAWTEQVKGTFLQLHEFIIDHPSAAPLLLRDLAHSPVAKKRAGVLLRILTRAGLEPAACAGLLSNLTALLVGHSLLGLWVEQEVGMAGPLDATESDDRAEGSRAWVTKVLLSDAGGLDGDSLSDDAIGGMGLVALTNGMGNGDRADVFRSGLDAVIAAYSVE